MQQPIDQNVPMSSASAQDNDDDDFMVPKENGRRTYLVTYSRADVGKFPTRESFGKMIARHFDAGKAKAKVEYFACGLEQHENGLPHYHMSLKLSGPKKWVRVKKAIQDDEGIVVNFGDKHDDYVMAFRYVCKADPEKLAPLSNGKCAIKVGDSNCPACRFSKAINGQMVFDNKALMDEARKLFLKS